MNRLPSMKELRSFLEEIPPAQTVGVSYSPHDNVFSRYFKIKEPGKIVTIRGNYATFDGVRRTNHNKKWVKEFMDAMNHEAGFFMAIPQRQALKSLDLIEEKYA